MNSISRGAPQSLRARDAAGKMLGVCSFLVLGVLLSGCTPGTPSAGNSASSAKATADVSSQVPAISDSARPTATDDGTASAAPEKDKKVEDKSTQSSSGEIQGESEDLESSWSKVENALDVAKDADLASQDPPKAKAVGLDDAVPAGTKASMRLDNVELTQGEADGIGQIAGPALMLKIGIDNESNDELDLSRMEITAYVGKDLTPTNLLTDSRSVALPAAVQSGETAEGTYLFSVPNAEPGTVTVQFSSGNEAEIQILVGEVKS